MRIASLLRAVVVGCILMSGCVPPRPETRPGLPPNAVADSAGELLPTGVRITPEVAEGRPACASPPRSPRARSFNP